MNKSKILSSTALGLILTLAGCTYLDRNDGVTSFAGDTQAINLAKHTVDPWNENAYDNDLEGDGERLSSVAKRYKKGELKPEDDFKSVNTRSQKDN
jgi:hypothetical protein